MTGAAGPRSTAGDAAAEGTRVGGAEGGPRVGGPRAAGLVIAGSLAMLGIVIAVNPARYGTMGAVFGVALLALGTMGTVALFRGPRRRHPLSADDTNTPGARDQYEL